MVVVHADSTPSRSLDEQDADGDSGLEFAERASRASSEASARREALQQRRDSICAIRRQRERRGYLSRIEDGDACPEKWRWSDLATDSPRPSFWGGSGPDTTPSEDVGARIGLHASPSDLSPMIGFSIGKLPFEFMVDYWIRIGYYDATVEIEPHHRAHYQEFRHGFVVGGRYDFGGPDFGFAPGAGLEWVGGDYAGLELDPEYEIQPWGGVSLRLPRRNFLGVRLLANKGVLGWFRVEWSKDFR